MNFLPDTRLFASLFYRSNELSDIFRCINKLFKKERYDTEKEKRKSCERVHDMLAPNSMLWKFLFVILFTTVWYYIVFRLGCRGTDDRFSPDRRRYCALSWEEDGKFYQRCFHIKSWKDKLPQRVPEGGFSKEHLDTVTPEYLDTFLTETCRGEWIHSGNLLLSAALLLIAPRELRMLSAILNAIVHLPYIMIQRYNRFRLLRCRNRLRRQQQRASGAPAGEQTAAC